MPRVLVGSAQSYLASDVVENEECKVALYGQLIEVFAVVVPKFVDVLLCLAGVRVQTVPRSREDEIVVRDVIIIKSA